MPTPVVWLLLAIGGCGLPSMLWFARGCPVHALPSTLAGTWVICGRLGYGLFNGSRSARQLTVDVDRRPGADEELDPAA